MIGIYGMDAKFPGPRNILTDSLYRRTLPALGQYARFVKPG